jgi:hypothetical protein
MMWTLHEDVFLHERASREFTEHLSKRKIFPAEIVEANETHILCSVHISVSLTDTRNQLLVRSVVC